MKKLLGVLLLIFTIIGCGRVRDNGVTVDLYNVGYDTWSGGAFIYYGEPFSGTVEVIDDLFNHDPKPAGIYEVEKGLYISKFKKYETNSDKVLYKGKLKYNSSDKKHYGTIKLNSEVYGDIKGAWKISPYQLSQRLSKNKGFFYSPSVYNILEGSANIDKAEVKIHLGNGYKAEVLIKDKHVLEYKLTNYLEDDILIMEYEADEMDKNGKFEFEMTLYKYSPKKYNYTVNSLVKNEEIYKKAKKITISGLAQYPLKKETNFGSYTGKIVPNYAELSFDPTTTYTISGGFGKTYYDDMMYIMGSNGEVKPFEFKIFDNPDLYDIIMDRLLISNTKEAFNKALNK